ncbi:retrovirus-related pol polyprotein from transposon TNT 1-94, partial [Tanacetum coccineum]
MFTNICIRIGAQTSSTGLITFDYVKVLRTDNGTEFVNQILRSYYEEVRILHQTSVACSVISLCRSSRDSLLYSKPITNPKMSPYELLYDRKPDLSYLHVFGALCYPTNDSEDLVPIVIALEPTLSTDIPSSTIIDQDTPSTSTSQTTQETPSPIIPLGVEEADHDCEVVHMDNSPYVDFPIP